MGNRGVGGDVCYGCGNRCSVLGIRGGVVRSQGELKGSPINTNVRREARAGGKPPALTFFVGGYATRSSRGDGVAYPPANI